MTENNKTDRKIKLMLRAVDMQNYTDLMKLGKDDIRDLVAPLADFLKKYSVRSEEGSSPEIADMMSRISDVKYFQKLLKEQLAKLYVSFGSDSHNIFAIAQRDDKFKEVWQNIIESPEISSSYLDSLLKRKIKVGSPPYWGNRYYCEALFYPLTVIDVDRGYYSYSYSKNNSTTYEFSLSTLNREKLAITFFGKEALSPIVVETLPEGKNLVTENFEANMPADLSYLSGVAMTGSVLSSTGSITATKLKSLKKTFKTGEFGSAIGEWPLDRIEMLVNAFFLFDEFGGSGNKKAETTKPERFAKFIVDKLPSCLSSTKFGVFLPAFKGFTKTWTEATNAGTVTKIIWKLISPAANGWLSLANLRLRYLCTDINGAANYGYNHLFYEDSRNRHTLKRKSDDLDVYDSRSKGIEWFDEIDFPFVLHWIKFLCATGLVEIAKVKGSESVKDDKLEGMRYVRLTPLGRYAYGFDKKYTAATATMASEIDIDDRNGIITVLSDNCPYTLFLQQISVTIGTNRFRITPESLLKNCDSFTKVYDRLDNLEQIVDVEKYPGLGAVVDEAEKRVKCAEWLPDDYAMLKLKPGLPGLVKLLTTDKEVRPNVILAEHGIFLVKRTFLYRLRTICSSHGYLLD